MKIFLYDEFNHYSLLYDHIWIEGIYVMRSILFNGLFNKHKFSIASMQQFHDPPF